MKIRKVTCWVLRIPFTFPLVKETQYALANFVEVETNDGRKGHALSTYPLKYGIREYINREAAPAIESMDALRPEEVRTKLFWATARKHFMGAWNCAVSPIDIAHEHAPAWRSAERRAHRVSLAGMEMRGIAVR